jgi:hypothetical protein
MPVFFGYEDISGAIVSNWVHEDLFSCPEFYHCADEQLEQELLKHFRWQKIPKGVGLSGSLRSFHEGYSPGGISWWESNICVGAYTSSCYVYWRTRSGRVYHPSDIPDCDDLEFWIEKLDVAAFLRALYGPSSLPFKLKNLSFELKTGAIDMSMTAFLLPAPERELNDVQKAVDDLTAEINQQSEAKGRKFGVVHNWRTETEGNGLRMNFDMGSADFTWLKKWLQALSDLNLLLELRLGRFPDVQQTDYESKI